jgi:hypothetical protein
MEASRTLSKSVAQHVGSSATEDTTESEGNQTSIVGGAGGGGNCAR